ncbi:MAG: hypothetical protein LUG13_06745 [Oscillospiraceae bacterium]|nr:hypothetical protein [Oscillospiraceae bacterium]
MEEVAGRKSTTTKIIIITCLINGILWVWCSYLLAYLGRTEIAESLSKVAITEIIGVVLVYCLKSLVENISKHNTWPDKGEKDTEETGAGDSGALND